MLAVPMACHAAASSDQTDITAEGARRDAFKIIARAHSGSTLIALAANKVSHSDQGKVLMLNDGGPATTGNNLQDLLGRVVAVPDENHLTLSLPCEITSTNLRGILGTDNPPFFQRCIEKAYVSNTVIQIPAGNYLLTSLPH